MTGLTESEIQIITTNVDNYCENNVGGYWRATNIYMLVLAVFILFLNGLLIFVILKTPKLRKQVKYKTFMLKDINLNIFHQKFNILMASLAMTDFLVGVNTPFSSLRICE